VKVFNVSSIQNDVPNFKVETTTLNHALIALDENNKFAWERDSITGEPSLHYTAAWVDQKYEIANSDVDKLIELRHKLYQKINITGTYSEFFEIQKRYDTCLFTSDYLLGWKPYDCGVFYYDLGFAAELAGDEKTAREMYSIIVEQYPDHPLALLAKNKLKR
jgi:tetratricopeptide (TPR) repeat protein